MAHSIGGIAPWRVSCIAALAAIGAVACALSLSRAAEPGSVDEAAAPFAGLPLSIVPNEGQVDERAAYHAAAPGAAFFFTRDSVRVALVRGDRGAAFDLRFVNARNARIVPTDRQPGRVNYLARGEKHAGLPAYGGVVYEDLWPGIDMALRGAGGALKYEFRIRRGADASAIRLAYRGAHVRRAAGGALLVQTPAGTITDSRPVSYQLENGRRIPVASSFGPLANGAFGFRLAPHDAGRTLVIDPGIAYSSFHGGSGGGEDEEIEDTTGIAVDNAGSAYVTGLTVSSNFPTTTGAFDTTRAGGDAFVSKFSPDGSSLEYSTFLGGSGADRGLAIAVGSDASAYVTGTTRSADFPITSNAYDTTLGVNDVFLTRLHPSGASLLYSTFFGGADQSSGESDFGYESPSAVAVGPEGTAVVAGDTANPDFPTTPSAYDRTLNGGIADAFVVSLDTASPTLVYSTLVGGAGSDHVHGLAVDADGRAHVAGYTHSPDYPTTPAAVDRVFDGEPEAFLTKLEPDASALSYSTFLGGSGQDFGTDVAVDAAGSAYLVGMTSSPDFPTTPGAFQVDRRGPTDAFVAKLPPSGATLDYATLIGGGYYDNPGGIDVDSQGRALIAGSASGGYPTTPDADRTTFDTQDVFLTRFNPAGSGLSYSTALGGSAYEMGRDVAVDPRGDAYVTGQTFSGDFPVTAGAFDEEYNFADSFVTKFAIGLPASTPGCQVSFSGRLRASNGDLATVRGKAVARRNRLGGHPTYRDHGPAEPLRLRSTEVHALACDGRQATVIGQGIVAGHGVVTYRIDARDGAPADTYRIVLSDGYAYDSGVQRLRTGNVRVRG